MPWHAAKSSNCPAGKPWAVIKDADGSVVACHPSKAAAQKQVDALYANDKSYANSPIGAAMSQGNYDGTEFRFMAHPDMELRLTDSELPTLAGHFAVFDEWTEINSRFEGRFLERIAPGAFSKTFNENRKNMRVLFQHGKDVLGEQILGSIEVLEEDKRGAYYEVPLYDGLPPLILNGLRDGQYGSSFRFRAMKEDFQRSVEPSDLNPEGLPERTIQEAKVMEFGPVTFPAYEGATAGLRSVTDWWIELSGRAATLESQEEPEPEPEPDLPEPTPPDEPSRRTRDHLKVREEDKPWRL